MMGLIKHSSMFDVFPKGYRPVYYDFIRRRAVCMPFGIHYVAIVLRRIWIWTFVWPRPDWLERHDAKVGAATRKACAEYCQILKKHEEEDSDADRT
jgi:hypothetical protein